MPASPPLHLIDRRDWLAASTLAAVQGLATGRAPAAADTLRLAVLGSGGRARHLLRSVVKIPGLDLVAIAEVRDDQVATTRKHLTDIAPAKADIPASRDFRALLERKDIDAVLIGSPDHWHAPMTLSLIHI